MTLTVAVAKHHRLYCFLDIDGVLHPVNPPPGNTLCHADNLVSALCGADPAGEIAVVISSTWRTHFTEDQLKAMLPRALADRMVGITPDHFERPGKYSRQREIAEWMDVNAPGAPWVAIDDGAEHFDKPCPNLFLVPGCDAPDGGGLTVAVVGALVKFLGAALPSFAPPRTSTDPMRTSRS